MAASNIPLPQQLTTVGNIATNWKKFKAQWNNYETATDLCKDPSKAKRTAIFLTCLSNDAYDVFESLQLDEEDSRDIEKVIQAFDTYCIGKINVTYERYVLNKRIQEENENFDAYLTAIRGLIKNVRIREPGRINSQGSNCNRYSRRRDTEKAIANEKTHTRPRSGSVSGQRNSMQTIASFETRTMCASS